jgi:hypothetical protein
VAALVVRPLVKVVGLDLQDLPHYSVQAQWQYLVLVQSAKALHFGFGELVY